MSATTIETVKGYASKHGISVADTWLLMCDKYADMDMWEESERCYLNYLDAK